MIGDIYLGVVLFARHGSNFVFRCCCIFRRRENHGPLRLQGGTAQSLCARLQRTAGAQVRRYLSGCQRDGACLAKLIGYVHIASPFSKLPHHIAQEFVPQIISNFNDIHLWAQVTIVCPTDWRIHQPFFLSKYRLFPPHGWTTLQPKWTLSCRLLPTMSTLEELDDIDRREKDDRKKEDKHGKGNAGRDGDAEMEEADQEEDILDDEVLGLSTQDILTRKRLLENDSRIMKSELSRLSHEKAAMGEKIKENVDKIANNRYGLMTRLQIPVACN